MQPRMEIFFFYPPLSVSNQNYTTEFAVTCRKKYFCLPSRPRSKAECCSFGCRRQFTAVLSFRVVSARAKERKGQTPKRVFTFPHSDEEVASSYSLPSEQAPISQTEPPDTLWSPRCHLHLMKDEAPICPQIVHSHHLPPPVTMEFPADRQFAEVIGFHSQGKVSAKDY